MLGGSIRMLGEWVLRDSNPVRRVKSPMLYQLS